jgi:putative salt-induced outer membrane protein YdiY
MLITDFERGELMGLRRFVSASMCVFLVSLVLGSLARKAYAEPSSAPSTGTTSVAASSASVKTTHESAAGVIVTGGNAPTESYNLKHASTWEWPVDLLKANASFLRTLNREQETARVWLLGLRYERGLSEFVSALVGQSVDSDRFAGIQQRYNTDLGAKYFLLKEDQFVWSAEAGYRYTLENRQAGQVAQNFVRAFTEAKRDWTPTFSTRVALEYLPNLTIDNDYQLNADLSANAAISEVFALSVAYGVRYRNVPVAPATLTTDTQFTTALVAKY